MKAAQTQKTAVPLIRFRSFRLVLIDSQCSNVQFYSIKSTLIEDSFHLYNNFAQDMVALTSISQ